MSVSYRNLQVSRLFVGDGNRGGVIAHKAFCAGGNAATIAAGGTNVCNISVQAVDNSGNPIAGARKITAYLSDANGGPGTAASAAMSVTGGTQISASTSHVEFVTAANGTATVVITDTAKTTNHVGMVAGGNPPIVSRQLQTADYG